MLEPKPRPGAVTQGRPGPASALGKGQRHHRRTDRVARLEPTAPQLLSDRRLQLAHALRIERSRLELGLVARDRGGRSVERVWLAGEQQHTGRRGGELEAVELGEVAQRLEMKLGQHRIEGMLNRARVAARRRAGELVALEELDACTGFGQEGSRGAAHDPAAHDRNVGRGAGGQSSAA